jgi:hypothetical protein
VKRFRSFSALREAIEKQLAASRPSFHRSPLEEVVQLLCEGRHYSWVGIYLAVPEPAAQPLLEAGADSDSQTPPSLRPPSRVLLTMTLGSRELGVLDVEKDRLFASGELVFLEQVADALARYLAGPGKFLARKARQTAKEEMTLAKSTSA